MTDIANRLLPAQGVKASGGSAKAGIPRYRATSAPTLFSSGFRPFFLLSGVWACIGIPLWLALYGSTVTLPTALPPAIWHAHEMIFGFAAATVAGFLLTAIPNWTGRMPLQGWPLAALVLLWAAGRIGVLLSAVIGPVAATVLDLLFPAAFLAVVAREILTGRNWRNLPMVGALAGLLLANALVHAAALGLADTAEFGNRFGIAILLLLISLIGGRIIPSFTRNWLARQQPDVPAPVPASRFDSCVLSVTAVALAAWLFVPETLATAMLCLAAGLAHALRLRRWRGLATLREPLLWVLHLGYAWLAAGFCLLGMQIVVPWLPPFTALHALTVGAIGTMTLAVMIRATLGHTGRPLRANSGTTAIFVLVTAAALFRLFAPFSQGHVLLALWLAGLAWSAAFGLFALLYLPALALPRKTSKA